jgi:predicted nucleic acid-binding protein
MICVDTSVWVAALRDEGGPEAQHIADLLDSEHLGVPVPVRIELLSGTSGADRSRLRRTLSALPTLLPEVATWSRIESWLDKAARAGERFGFADLLIGAIAADHGAELWSNDADFSRMARLGLITLHGPR